MSLYITRFIQLIVTAAFVGVVWWYGSTVWDNHQVIQLCRDEVTDKVNGELTALNLPNVSSVDFYETSVLFGIPPHISFGKSIPNSDERGSAYMGNVEGSVDLPNKTMEFEIVTHTGDRHRFERKLFE